MRERQKLYLQRILAGIVAAVLFVTGFFSGATTDEEDLENERRQCDRGLSVLAELAGDTVLCTHGPDPIADVADQRAANLDAQPARAYPPLGYRLTDMCPGDGVSGHRIRTYVGAPGRLPTDDEFKLAQVTISWAERQLRNSHPVYAQKLNFYCATDKTPTIERIALPEIVDGNDYHFDVFSAPPFDDVETKTNYAVILVGDSGRYPYCGEETVMGNPDPDATSLNFPQFGLVACLGDNDTFLHETGHGMGGVQPGAHDSTGNGWHCTDLTEVMCYNDGGSGITASNPMQHECDPATHTIRGARFDTPRFDCDGEFWQPDPALDDVGFFAETFNVSHSPYLTKPRRK